MHLFRFAMSYFVAFVYVMASACFCIHYVARQFKFLFFYVPRLVVKPVCYARSIVVSFAVSCSISDEIHECLGSGYELLGLVQITVTRY